MITQDRLKELLHYNPDTGIFTWISKTGHQKIGDVAGSRKLQQSGKYRISISIFGVQYKAHRLAWFYVTGKWPTKQIDHKDGDSENNKFHNLRDVSQQLNNQNRNASSKDNLSGLLGVGRIKQGNRIYWQARIYANGKHHYLGNFRTPEEAHKAYIEAKSKLHIGYIA